MIPKPIDAITAEDILSLISNEVRESRTIEYKEEFPGSNDKDSKRKLLRVICSLANSTGGDLLIGVAASNGIPVSLSPLPSDKLDESLLAVENACRDGIEPRLPRFHARTVEVEPSQHIVVLRVGRSWLAPHRLTADGHFYGRNSAGSYPMDAGEVRESFLLSDSISERVAAFRKERLDRFLTNKDVPVSLSVPSDGLLVLTHLIPLTSFASASRKARLTLDPQERFDLSPMGSSAHNTTINIDGYVISTRNREGEIGYTQVFRSGIIESAFVLGPIPDHGKAIPARWLEANFAKWIRSCGNKLQQKGIEPPYFLFLTMQWVRDAKLLVGIMDFSSLSTNSDRLQFDEVLIEEWPTDPFLALRPLFDSVWNAFGYEQCSHYDEMGQYVAR
jgi:hypothetical protein